MINASLPPNVPALILAGGLGSRLRPVLPTCQKVVAPVQGRPFLAYWLDRLCLEGPRNVVLCAGYQSESVRHQIGNSWGVLRIDYSVESTPLGTAGALRHALTSRTDSLVLALNGDSFCELDLSGFWRAHQASGFPAGIAVTQVPDAGRYGQVKIEPSGRLSGFQEKSPNISNGWINAGIYLLPREWLMDLPPEQPWSLERDLLPSRIASGILGYRVEKGAFIDIGTPESYCQAQGFFNIEPRVEDVVTGSIEL